MEKLRQLRIEWMRLYGLDQEEIDKSLLEYPPTDESEEQKQLDAVIIMKNLPPIELKSKTGQSYLI